MRIPEQSSHRFQGYPDTYSRCLEYVFERNFLTVGCYKEKSLQVFIANICNLILHLNYNLLIYNNVICSFNLHTLPF